MQPESRILRVDLAGCGFVDGKGGKWNVRNVVQETRVTSAASGQVDFSAPCGIAAEGKSFHAGTRGAR